MLCQVLNTGEIGEGVEQYILGTVRRNSVQIQLSACNCILHQRVNLGENDLDTIDLEVLHGECALLRCAVLGIKSVPAGVGIDRNSTISPIRTQREGFRCVFIGSRCPVKDPLILYNENIITGNINITGCLSFMNSVNIIEYICCKESIRNTNRYCLIDRRKTHGIGCSTILPVKFLKCIAGCIGNGRIPACGCIPAACHLNHCTLEQCAGLVHLLEGERFTVCEREGEVAELLIQIDGCAYIVTVIEDQILVRLHLNCLKLRIVCHCAVALGIHFISSYGLALNCESEGLVIRHVQMILNLQRRVICHCQMGCLEGIVTEHLNLHLIGVAYGSGELSCAHGALILAAFFRAVVHELVVSCDFAFAVGNSITGSNIFDLSIICPV